MAAEQLGIYPETGRHDQFLASLKQSERGWANREPVMSTFFGAMHEVVTLLPEAATHTQAYLDSEEGKPTSYTTNKLFKAVQCSLIDERTRYELGYPGRFVTTEAWKAILPRILLDEGSVEHARYNNALSRPDQKNRPERAKAAAFAATALLDREAVHDGLVYHEYGASANNVLTALAADETGRAVMKRGNKRSAMRDDRGDTMTFYAATRGARFGEGYGVEMLPPQTEDDMNTIKAFSLRPSEMDRDRVNGQATDANYEETFDRFTLAEPEAPIHTIQGNFLELGESGDATLRANPADVALLSHVPSQNPEQLDDMFKNLLEKGYISSRGIIVVNEYAQFNAESGKFEIMEDWSKPWQVTTFVMEARRPEAGLIPIIKWKNSHCTVGTLIWQNFDKFAATDLLYRRT